MNVAEKDAAQRFTGLVVQLVQGFERQELLPHETLNEARIVMGDADEAVFVTGGIVSCDVALKRLAKMAWKVPVRQAAEGLGPTIAELEAQDRLDVGDQAYDDAARMAVVFAEAMVDKRSLDFPGEFGDMRRVAMGCFALLVASLLELGRSHGMTVSEAAQRFALDIAGTTPK